MANINFRKLVNIADKSVDLEILLFP